MDNTIGEGGIRMYEREIRESEIRTRKVRMAICYDFDKTLSPDDMQTFTLIPSFDLDAPAFWNESNQLARENLMDNNLAWMYKLIQYSKLKRKPISRDYFKKIGINIPLYKGVKTWFERMTKYAKKKGIELEHYIISSGLKEIIEGTVIAPYFRRIYGSSYLYSPDGVAEWPAQAINYTNKTQFLFRIAKGVFEEYDEQVNNSMSAEDLYIPYENIVYIGDSSTDIPCMRLVKSRGGYSIGVFDPEKNTRKKVYQLFGDDRISFYAAADYTPGSDLAKYMQYIIDEVAAREKIKTERKILSLNSEAYSLYLKLKDLVNSGTFEEEKEKVEENLQFFRSRIEGDIDT